MPRTFHNLTAGSTTIMPDGKVLRFGGKIERIEGLGTKVGNGTYITDDPAEIDWLVSLTKMPTPQVWEETKVEEGAMPAKVAAGTVADTEKVVKENNETAARATSPKVVELQEKLGEVIAKTGQQATPSN